MGRLCAKERLTFCARMTAFLLACRDTLRFVPESRFSSRKSGGCHPISETRQMPPGWSGSVFGSRNGTSQVTAKLRVSCPAKELYRRGAVLKNTIEKIHDSIGSLFGSLKPRCKAITTPFSDIGHAEMTQIFSESTAQALSRTGSYYGSGWVPVTRR